MFKSIKYFDWPFFAAVLILTLVGLTMIYSTGLPGQVEARSWLRQAAALGIGLLGLVFFSSLDYRFFKKNSAVLYGLSVLFLLGVVVFAHSVRGSARWFDLGFFNFQPSEFAKFALIILLAKFFQAQQPFLQKFRFVAVSFVYVAVPLVLILLEPDLGSATVLVALWLGMILVSSMPRRFFLYLLVIFLVLSAAVWQFFLRDYQQDRLRTFLDPTGDPLGRGYNVIQSMVAVGSGGVFGRGLARGLQSQLKFLPERQTDFIFASTVEELGFVGGALVLLLLGFILYRMIRIMKNAGDLFGIYLAAGIIFLVMTQSIVNIGMNLGLLPVTGITLPFLSYGGSSLVIMLWLVGIMQSLHRHSAPVRFS